MKPKPCIKQRVEIERQCRELGETFLTFARNRLGPPTRIEASVWVWEGPAWQLRVSNQQGFRFKVLPDLTPEQTDAAWQECWREREEPAIPEEPLPDSPAGIALRVGRSVPQSPQPPVVDTDFAARLMAQLKANPRFQSRFALPPLRLLWAFTPLPHYPKESYQRIFQHLLRDLYRLEVSPDRLSDVCAKLLEVTKLPIAKIASILPPDLQGRETQIQVLLPRLPEMEAAVFDLWFVQHQQQIQIAAQLGVSQPSVCYRIKRLLDRLRFLLRSPDVDLGCLERDLATVLPDPIDVKVMMLIWQTTCQLAVADQIGASQGFVRHRFLRSLGAIRKIPEFAVYTNQYDEIRKNQNILREVRSRSLRGNPVSVDPGEEAPVQDATSSSRIAIYVRAKPRGWDLEACLGDLQSVAKSRKASTVEQYIDETPLGSLIELDRMLADARAKKFDLLLVWSLDQLAQSPRQLLALLVELQSLGIGFVSIGDPGIDTTLPQGGVFLFLKAVTELERSLKQERIQAGVERARAAGIHCGRPKREFENLHKAKDLFEKGHSLREIASMLVIPRGTLRRRLAEVEQDQ